MIELYHLLAFLTRRSTLEFEWTHFIVSSADKSLNHLVAQAIFERKLLGNVSFCFSRSFYGFLGIIVLSNAQISSKRP